MECRANVQKFQLVFEVVVKQLAGLITCSFALLRPNQPRLTTSIRRPFTSDYGG
jgi:hypothetical protein